MAQQDNKDSPHLAEVIELVEQGNPNEGRADDGEELQEDAPPADGFRGGGTQ